MKPKIMNNERTQSNILQYTICHFVFIVLAAAGAMALTGFDGCHSPTQPGKTDTVTVKTGPDTSSGNFTWTLDTIAEGGDLKGVIVFNDTEVYVCGEMYLLDSATEQPSDTEYTLAFWNGKKWTYSNLESSIGYISPALGLYGFSPNDFWYMDGAPAHWMGPPVNQWTGYNLNGLNMSRGDGLNGFNMKMWGTSSSNIYFAGNGSLVYFNGVNMSAINTNSPLATTGIYGGINPQTKKEEIICISSNGSVQPISKGVYSVNGATTTQLSDSGLAWLISDIWFVPDSIYYIFGDGIFYKNNIYDTTQWIAIPKTTTQQYGLIYMISAQGANDIITAGGDGDILHYNGKTWQSYYATTQIYGNYNAISLKGNTVCAAGVVGGGPMNEIPVVLIGKRQ